VPHDSQAVEGAKKIEIPVKWIIFLHSVCVDDNEERGIGVLKATG